MWRETALNHKNELGRMSGYVGGKGGTEWGGEAAAGKRKEEGSWRGQMRRRTQTDGKHNSDTEAHDGREAALPDLTTSSSLSSSIWQSPATRNSGFLAVCSSQEWPRDIHCLDGHRTSGTKTKRNTSAVIWPGIEGNVCLPLSVVKPFPSKVTRPLHLREYGFSILTANKKHSLFQTRDAIIMTTSCFFFFASAILHMSGKERINLTQPGHAWRAFPHISSDEAKNKAIRWLFFFFTGEKPSITHRFHIMRRTSFIHCDDNDCCVFLVLLVWFTIL